MTVLTDCDCGMLMEEHDQPLVLLHHDQEMRRAMVERLRKRLNSPLFLGARAWFEVDTALTDEEVGR
jgi:hypothetical protein